MAGKKAFGEELQARDLLLLVGQALLAQFILQEVALVGDLQDADTKPDAVTEDRAQRFDKSDLFDVALDTRGHRKSELIGLVVDFLLSTERPDLRDGLAWLPAVADVTWANHGQGLLCVAVDARYQDFAVLTA